MKRYELRRLDYSAPCITHAWDTRPMGGSHSLCGMVNGFAQTFVEPLGSGRPVCRTCAREAVRRGLIDADPR